LREAEGATAAKNPEMGELVTAGPTTGELPEGPATSWTGRRQTWRPPSAAGCALEDCRLTCRRPDCARGNTHAFFLLLPETIPSFVSASTSSSFFLLMLTSELHFLILSVSPARPGLACFFDYQCVSVVGTQKSAAFEVSAAAAESGARKFQSNSRETSPTSPPTNCIVAVKARVTQIASQKPRQPRSGAATPPSPTTETTTTRCCQNGDYAKSILPAVSASPKFTFICAQKSSFSSSPRGKEEKYVESAADKAVDVVDSQASPEVVGGGRDPGRLSAPFQMKKKSSLLAKAA